MGEYTYATDRRRQHTRYGARSTAAYTESQDTVMSDCVGAAAPVCCELARGCPVSTLHPPHPTAVQERRKSLLLIVKLYSRAGGRAPSRAGSGFSIGGHG